MDVEPRLPEDGGARPSSWRARLRSLAIDASPLRESRDFRLLWLGNAISWFGTQVTFVAIPIQVYRMTESSLAVGLLGVSDLVPLLTLPLIGGALADNVDRRRLLLATETVATLSVLALLVHARADEQHLWVMYVLNTLLAAAYAIGSPALRSATPLLVRPERITAAAVLTGAYQNFASVAGPAVAGVLVATVGLAWTYALDALTFGASLVALAAIRPIPPVAGERRPTLRAALDGLRWLKGRRVLLGSFLVDVNAMVFGMPEALFPALAIERFGGPEIVGLLYAAPSAGALLASLVSGWTSRVHRHGVIVYAAVVAWGAALVAFGLAPNVAVALAALAAAGAADAVSATFRTAILQTATPHDMLGRMEGVSLAVVASGPSLGNVEAGVVASLTNARVAVVGGGLACIVGVGVMALLLPEFARYDARDPTP
ncbi:MAG TPA: MFS transporter [Actinomycetota bacterium]|nr:MFS transporter [Actinomycetota bacterium]